MINLSVNIGCEESIEVVLQPFENQFSAPGESTVSPDDDNFGLLQSSVNIRQIRRSSFHFDDVDAHEDSKVKCTVQFPNLDSTKNEMAAIDRKIQSLLKKYKKKPQSDSNSLKSSSTTTTLECDSISSMSSSFSDDGVPRARHQAHKFTGIIPLRLEIPTSISAKQLGEGRLQSLHIK
ncbi:MAG: hypothetical protein SGBAC_007309 [Bacillariaceae sp.]